MYIVLLNCQILSPALYVCRVTEISDFSGSLCILNGMVMSTENKVELLCVEQVTVGTLPTEVQSRVGKRPSLSRFDKELTSVFYCS